MIEFLHLWRNYHEASQLIAHEKREDEMKRLSNNIITEKVM